MPIRNRLAFFNLREQTGFLRNLVIRNTLSGNVMVIVVFFYEDEKRREGLLDFLVGNFLRSHRCSMSSIQKGMIRLLTRNRYFTGGMII